MHPKHLVFIFIIVLSSNNHVASFAQTNPAPIISNPLQTFYADNPSSNARFGWSTAFLDDTVIVAADSGLVGDTNAGALYRFNSSDGSRLTPSKFNNPTPQQFDRFGFSLQTDGGDLLVGDTNHNVGSADNAGVAYLIDGTNGSVKTTFKSPRPTSFDILGSSVATVGGNRVVVGGHNDDSAGDRRGIAHVYNKTSGNLDFTLANPVADFNAFGRSAVSIGDSIFIGAPTDNSNGSNAGRVYKYSATTGQFQGAIENPNPTAGSHFGWSLYENNGELLVGAPGGNSGNSDASDSTNPGAVYALDPVSGASIQTYQSPSASAADFFGHSISAIGNSILIGAPKDDSLTTNAGRAFSFDTSGNLTHVYDNPDAQQGDFFGWSVAANQNKVLVGAHADDTQGTNAGAAYLFEGVFVQPEPMATRWKTNVSHLIPGDWHNSGNWDNEVPRGNVDAIIDKPSGHALVNGKASAKSLLLDNNAKLTVSFGGVVTISNGIIQQVADVNVRGDSFLNARNINLAEHAHNELNVSDDAQVQVSNDIRLSQIGDPRLDGSLSISDNGFVRAKSISGGLQNLPAANAVSIRDNATLEVAQLHVGRIDQDGGILKIGRNGRAIVSSHHNLSGGAILQVETGASYNANSLSISGSVVIGGLNSFVQLSDRTSFSIAGNQVQSLNTHIIHGRVSRNGSPLGLLATLDGDGNTRVVYAPDLSGDLMLEEAGFHPIEIHNPLPDPQPIPQKQNRDNLVVMVHGWNSSADTWQNPDSGNMVTTLAKELIHRREDGSLGSDWDVGTYDWEENAGTWIDSIPLTPPLPATKANAHAHGAHLASQILEGDYENIHLIAHSLGGRVIDTASRILRANSWDGTIHLTFLDAYTPNDWESFFGSDANWADHYYHNQFLSAPETQDDFVFARNVGLNELITFPEGDVSLSARSHAYPIDWYFGSIGNQQLWLTEDGLIPYGFALSQEAGYSGWESNDLPDIGIKDSLTSTIVIRPGQPPQWTQQYLQTQPIQLINFSSPVFGTVEVIEDALSMVNGELALPVETGSLAAASSGIESVWANIELNLENESNAIEFDIEFPLNADGVLTAFINGEPIWSVVEEFAYASGVFSSEIITLDGILPPGLHSLGFRLDSLDGNQSSVLITNVRTSIISTVPEPTSILLALFSVFLGVIIGQRRAVVNRAQARRSQ